VLTIRKKSVSCLGVTGNIAVDLDNEHYNALIVLVMRQLAVTHDPDEVILLCCYETISVYPTGTNEMYVYVCVCVCVG